MPLYPSPDLYPDPGLYPGGGQSAGDIAVQFVQHLRVNDESDPILEGLVRGLCDGLERLATVAYGTPDCPAERVLTDPSVCPFWALPHAAQYVGGVIPPRPPGLTDDQWEAYARAAVLEPFGAFRGSPRAMRTLAAAYLVPGADFRVLERYDGEPFDTLIVAAPADCPDPDLLLAAVNADDVVIAGGRVLLTLTDSTTWADLASTTWTDLSAVTWQQLDDGTYP